MKTTLLRSVVTLQKLRQAAETPFAPHVFGGIASLARPVAAGEHKKTTMRTNEAKTASRRRWMFHRNIY
ncbi:MAG TPA: hypothetical protein VIT00_04560 [Terrimicrobiaceae bacterium]